MSLNVTLSVSVDTGGTKPIVIELYSGNCTHNLANMAREAGIYKCVWRPEENGISSAGQLIEPLQEALELINSEPLKFKALNPPNGWGSDTWLKDFLNNYLDACIKHPKATVHACR